MSAANIKDGKIILRLFNAEGDRKQHNITFDMPLSSIEEVDLNGRIIDRKTIKHVPENLKLVFLCLVSV